MRRTYELQVLWSDGWHTLLEHSLDYLNGYLDGGQYDTPRKAKRIVRSDGRVMRELSECPDVCIGPAPGGSPTPQQYRDAAVRAFKKADWLEEFRKHRADRTPRPPAELVDALHDRLHDLSEGLLSQKVKRNG